MITLRGLGIGVGLLGGGALLIGLLNAPPVPAAAAALSAGVITVTTTEDQFDNPAPPGSACSLREAIEAINLAMSFGGCEAGAPGDTILLAADSTYTLTQAGFDDTNVGGDLDPAAAMLIRPVSGRAVISAAGLGDRVMDIHAGGRVELQDLTLTGGDVRPLGVPNGGGIRNSAVLTLTRTDLVDNAAQIGGGLYNAETPGVALWVADSNIMLNVTSSDGGGGLYNQGQAVITGSSIISNTALLGEAGGISNFLGTLTLRNVTISGNRALQAGGIRNASTLVMNNVTVANNEATYTGGGIANLTNRFEVSNSLIEGNSNGLATGGPDCYDASGGIHAVGTAKGYTLVGVLDSASCHFAGDLTTLITTSLPASAVLGPLGLYGGRTYTHPLVAGSPALDRGSPAPPAGGLTCETKDQRGVTRIGICDLGAYDTAQLAKVYLPLMMRN